MGGRGARLGLHVHRPSPAVDAAIAAAPWAAVKALASVQPLATARAAGIPLRILRCPGLERLAPAEAARAFLALHLGDVTHLQLVCEDERGTDLIWQSQTIAALRAGGYQGGVLGFGFATGTPATVVAGEHVGPHFPEWLPLGALFPLLDGVALDEYVGTTVDDPSWAAWLDWTGRRSALVADCLGRHGRTLPPVFITESGLDDVIPGRGGGGWQKRGIDADRYVATLIALDQGDQQDARVRCRCLFTLNASEDWAAYEVGGIVDRLAAYVREQAEWPARRPEGEGTLEESARSEAGVGGAGATAGGEGDPATEPAEATAVARFAALGVRPYQAGAIFRAYVLRTRVWLAADRCAILDPTPAIRPEWSNGRLARCAFDSGEIYEWRAADGRCSLVEAKDRERVWKECDW